MQLIAHCVSCVLFAAEQLMFQYLTASGLSDCEWLLPPLWRVVVQYVGASAFGTALRHRPPALCVISVVLLDHRFVVSARTDF